MVLIALAGSVANIVLATLAAALFHLVPRAMPRIGYEENV
jgi:hypothetical protein